MSEALHYNETPGKEPISLIGSSLQNLIDTISLSSLAEPLPDTDAVREYSKLFIDLFSKNNDAKKIIQSIKSGSRITPSENILKLLGKVISQIDSGRDEEIVSGAGVKIGQAQKWAYIPKLIKEWKTLNCSGAAALCTSVLKSLGLEAYLGNPVGHAITLVKFPNGEWYYLDPRNNTVERMDDVIVVENPRSRIKLAKLGHAIAGYTLIPMFTSVQDSLNHTIRENHEAMDEEAKAGEKDALLAKKLLGAEDFQMGLELPTIKEKELLDVTDEWKAEEESSGADDDVNNGIKIFAKTLGPMTSDLIQLLNSDFVKVTTIISMFKMNPIELEKMNSKLIVLNEDIESLFNIPAAAFLSAHKEFWEKTERIRMIDPNRFGKQLEAYLRLVIRK